MLPIDEILKTARRAAERHFSTEIVGIGINILTDDSTKLDWLRSYLDPYVINRDLRQDSFTSVIHVEHKDLADSIAQFVTANSNLVEKIPFFLRRTAYRVKTGNRTGVVVPLSNDGLTQNGRRTFPIPIFPEYEAYLYDADSVLIVSRQQMNGSPTELTRVVREVAFKALLNDEHRFVLHASGVVGKQGSVLFCGKKGSGKSTLLLKCLSTFDCQYLSNDRILCTAGKTLASAHNVPMTPVFLLESLDGYPGLLERIRTRNIEVGYPQVRWWETSEEQGRKEGFKIGIVQRNVATLFGRGISPGGSIKAIFVVERGDGLVNIEQLMSTEDVASLLLGHVIDEEDDISPDVFELGKSSRGEGCRDGINASLKAMAKTTKVFRVRGKETAEALVKFLFEKKLLNV